MNDREVAFQLRTASASIFAVDQEGCSPFT